MLPIIARAYIKPDVSIFVFKKVNGLVFYMQNDF